MSTTVGLFVAILDDGGVFQHWGLFIDDAQEANKFLLQVKGSDGRFRYEPETLEDARQANRLVELIPLCNVDATKTSMIGDVARNVPVRSDIHGWNCQDFVLDLLDSLEEEQIINGNDKNYRKQQSIVRGKLEGLV